MLVESKFTLEILHEKIDRVLDLGERQIVYHSHSFLTLQTSNFSVISVW